MNYILYNPLSGTGKAEENAKSLNGFDKNNTIYQDVSTITDYNTFVENLTENDVLVLCGGDGTLNRFINDTDGLDIPCDILYVASGTGNDFLNDIEKSKEDCPLSIKKYLKDLPSVTVKGKSYRFINNVGYGIDGYCCEVGDELKKKSDKPVNYTAIAIKGLLFHYKPTNATVIVDGKEYSYKKVWIAPTMKGRYYGGGMIATPSQDRTDADGKLSVMLFYGKGRLRTLMVFPSIFKGEHIKHKNMVSIHMGNEITVKFDRPAPLQIDGETILGVTEYTAVSQDFAPNPTKLFEKSLDQKL